jgi:hypothetical protein
LVQVVKAEAKEGLPGVEAPEMAVDVSIMKVTTAMAQSAAKHFIAAQAYREDQENAVQMRDTTRLIFGEECRATKSRGLAKIEKVVEGIDKNADTVSAYISLMAGCM